MIRKTPFLTAGALLATLLVGCSMVSGDPLATPALRGDANLTILQTTDIHNAGGGIGHVGAGVPGQQGDYARISAYVEQVRATCGNPVILVDSGDWSMGTCYDLTLGQQPLPLLFMDALRYDCATLGNHEFDYSPAGLARFLNAAQHSFSFRTPLVASNTSLNGNLDLVPYYGVGKAIEPSHVQVLANGLRVGFLGLLGKDATGAAPAAAPVSFTDYSQNYALIQGLVDELRIQQHCHVVVVLSHAGTDATGTTGEDVELARHVTGIDVIAAGHAHNPLAAAHTVVNGAWNTRIICAGAYGSNVARIDLAYHADRYSTTLLGSENQAMTDANLAALKGGLGPDPAVAFLVASADQQLNAALQAVFTQVARFPDYDPGQVATGIYHPVASAAQLMASNDKTPAPGPNGMGNLCADAVRAVPNAIIARMLMANGWTGSASDPNLPVIQARLAAAGFDPAPYQAAVVATGVIRNRFPAGVALSFADVYNVLPLGTSPDLSQAIPIGYPLLSAYLTVADLQKLCALQLLAQTDLASSDFYLNLSGLRYSLKPDELSTYFRFATAAGALEATVGKARAGSSSAQAGRAAVASLASDGGVALLAALQVGNPYAAALVNLNDRSPSPAQVAVNLGALSEVAAAAAVDASAGSSSLSVLMLAKAVAAVDTLSGFSASDPACVGSPRALASGSRHRLAADLYVILMMGAAQARFGTAITAYQAATGSGFLTGANLPAAMANRINLDPAASTLQETKTWMALLLYLITPPDRGGPFSGGRVGPEYYSSGDFTQFDRFGAAVQVRSASYPVAEITQFMATLAALNAAP